VQGKRRERVKRRKRRGVQANKQTVSCNSSSNSSGMKWRVAYGPMKHEGRERERDRERERE
jgi:hypothetical protein